MLPTQFKHSNVRHNLVLCNDLLTYRRITFSLNSDTENSTQREVVNQNKRWLCLHWGGGEEHPFPQFAPRMFTFFHQLQKGKKARQLYQSSRKELTSEFHMEDHFTKGKPKIRWDILGLKSVSHLWSDLTLSLGSVQPSSLFSICFTVSSKRIPVSRKTVATHHNKDCKYCISKMQSNLKTTSLTKVSNNNRFI